MRKVTGTGITLAALTLGVIFGTQESKASPTPAPLDESYGLALADVLNVAGHFVGDTEEVQFVTKKNRRIRKQNKGEIVAFSFQFCFVQQIRPGQNQEYERKDGNPWCQCFVNAVTSLAMLFETNTKDVSRNYNESASTMHAYESAGFRIGANGMTQGKLALRTGCRLELGDVSPGWAMTFERGPVDGVAGHVGIVSGIRGPFRDGTYEVETIEGNVQEDSGRTESEREETPEGVFRKLHYVRWDGNRLALLDENSGLRLKGFYPTVIPKDPGEACAALTGNRQEPNETGDWIYISAEIQKNPKAQPNRSPAGAISRSRGVDRAS